MRRPNPKLWFLCFAVIWLVFGVAYVLTTPPRPAEPANVLNDASGLHRTVVREVVTPTSEEQIRQAVARAVKAGWKVAVAGKKHSMGGHAFYRGALVLDMTQFDRVGPLDDKQRVVTVQSGVTWD